MTTTPPTGAGHPRKAPCAVCGKSVAIRRLTGGKAIHPHNKPDNNPCPGRLAKLP